MSTKEQRNQSNTSTQAAGGQQLTATNFAVHNQNTHATPTGQVVRSWLNDIGFLSERNVDQETWMTLVERDAVAADIEAGLRDGNQNGAH